MLCYVQQSKKKKPKYSAAAVGGRRATFTPFVVSVDGVLGHDAQHLMKRLGDQIALKWEKSHSVVMGWVRARLAFAILRATNFCLRGSREVDMAWMMVQASPIFHTDLQCFFLSLRCINVCMYVLYIHIGKKRKKKKKKLTMLYNKSIV